MLHLGINMKIFYKSIILFWIILLFLSCNSIDDLSKEEDEELIYKYEKHKNNRIASLIMDDNQYNEWVKNYAFKNDEEKLKELIKDIYKVFPDEYDIILLILNEDSLLSSFVNKNGQSVQASNFGVSNKIKGIGSRRPPGWSERFDYGSDYGSNKIHMLKNIIHQNTNANFNDGPILHELMHNWSNFCIETEGLYETGSNLTSFPVGKYIYSYSYPETSGEVKGAAHWGFTGGNIRGYLGGFEQSTLEELGNNTYLVDGFSMHGNSYQHFSPLGNRSYSPYNELELYLAGMIPIDSVKDFDVFKNITSLKSKGLRFEFVSSSRTTFTSESLLDSLGKRIPDFKTSQKHFKMLEIIITNKPLTEDEWEVFDKDAEWFAYKGSDENLVGNDFHKFMYNFYEATKGKGSITIGY